MITSVCPKKRRFFATIFRLPYHGYDPIHCRLDKPYDACKGDYLKRFLKLKTMALKIIRTSIAIAICWFIAYGLGSAASHCCGASGVRAPLVPANATHCQPSPSHHLNQHRSVEEGYGSSWHDFDDHATCCPTTPCAPKSFTAVPVQSSPSPTWLQAASITCTTDVGYGTFEVTQNRHNPDHPTLPIFLLTKSIIC